MVPGSSGVGCHSRCAAARAWSRCCPAATCWAGWACLPGHEMHETSKVDWVLAARPTMRPGLLWGFGIDVPKANGTGRHGWWCGCAGLCPISVGWRPFIHGSTIVLSEANYGSRCMHLRHQVCRQHRGQQ